MNRKFIITVVIIFAVVGLSWLGVFAWNNFRGAGPAFNSPSGDITEQIPATSTFSPSSTPISSAPPSNTSSMPLSLPAGFSISIFAKDVADARVMAFDGLGGMWVSQPDKGQIMFLEVKDGVVVNRSVIFKNLNKPHGLAIDPENKTMLYFAEENKISRVALYTEDSPHKILDLPSGGNHTSRTIGFGPDGKLYISVGSSCNVCEESNPLRAAIYSVNKDGSNLKQVASGLRNSVFFTWQNGNMYATDNGRDYLGDNLPPDEVNIVQQSNSSVLKNILALDKVPDFGWPICYGQNIHDSNFDKKQYFADPCREKVPPLVEIQAHSAPLGLAFTPGSWPAEFKNTLLVALHGSWNRTVPTGFKIIDIKLSSEGTYQSTSDFISGWLPKGSSDKGALGRPVDLVFGKDDALYISDDKAGVIYKVVYRE